MSRGLNKAVLIGYVGARPELRTTRTGARVATFPVATHRSASDGERTDWHQVVAWDEWALQAERTIEVGSRVYVEGHLSYRTAGGRSRKRGPFAEIIVEELILVDSRATGARETPVGKERFIL